MIQELKLNILKGMKIILKNIKFFCSLGQIRQFKKKNLTSKHARIFFSFSVRTKEIKRLTQTAFWDHCLNHLLGISPLSLTLEDSC